MVKRQRNGVWALLMIFLLVSVMIVFISIKPMNLTGFVVGPEGQTCDGNWTCGDWGTCAESLQTRECTSADSSNCASLIIESQSCEEECIESWTCADWGVCENEIQTRICTDANSCGTTDDKPEETQDCTIACVENWACGDWQECSGGTQTRTCLDANSCNTTATKPTESQSCTTTPCMEDWSCGSWGECNSEIRTRTCTDVNSCGTTTIKPIESRSCPASSGTSSSSTTTPTTKNTQTNQTTQTTKKINVTICSPDWKCSDWTECTDSSQTRSCADANACDINTGKPTESQSCTIPETCEDGAKNQDETGVDCGGVCANRCSIFTLAGSVVRAPIESGKQFITNWLSNKTKLFISIGVLVAGIAGFVVFKVFLKKKMVKK